MSPNPHLQQQRPCHQFLLRTTIAVTIALSAMLRGVVSRRDDIIISGGFEAPAPHAPYEALLLWAAAVGSDENTTAGTNMSATNTTLTPEAAGHPSHHLTNEQIGLFIGLSVGLVTFAGLCSGLTIALFSLDVMRLRIIVRDDLETVTRKQRAKRLLNLLSRTHLVLVALLVSNAAAMTALPLMLEEILPTAIVLIVSVTAVLFAGEVIPQALFVRNNFIVCALLTPFVWFLIGLTFIVAWPIGRLLDVVVGHRETLLSQQELGRFIEETARDGLAPLELGVILGAMKLRRLTIGELKLIAINEAHMLPCDAVLDANVAAQLLEWGHSRVPLYNGTRAHIVGVLNVRKLVAYVAERSASVTPVISPGSGADGAPAAAAFPRAAATTTPKALLSFSEPLVHVNVSTPLIDLYSTFQSGAGTMAAVFSARGNILHGFLTLNDVFECIHQQAASGEQDVLDSTRRSAMAKAVDAVKQELRMQSQVGRASAAAGTSPGIGSGPNSSSY